MLLLLWNSSLSYGIAYYAIDIVCVLEKGGKFQGRFDQGTVNSSLLCRSNYFWEATGATMVLYGHYNSWLVAP